MLRSFPSGIDLVTIPFPGASVAQQEAELFNICTRATADAVRICEQELRATVNTESDSGPDWRITLNAQGIAEFRLFRWPILRVLSARVAPAATFPRQFTTIPLDHLAPKYIVPSEFGSIAPDAAALGANTLQIAPGYVTWRNGRAGCYLEVTYLNGWPHCGITSEAFQYDDDLIVDDTTGWVGVTGTIYDGANTESVLVTATSTPSGPGTLTLATPLLYGHTPPLNETVVFSALPADVFEAVFYLCIEQALVRGATAVTVPSLPGAETHTGRDSGDLIDRAKDILNTYRRSSW